MGHTKQRSWIPDLSKNLRFGTIHVLTFMTHQNFQQKIKFTSRT